MYLQYIAYTLEPFSTDPTPPSTPEHTTQNLRAQTKTQKRKRKEKARGGGVILKINKHSHGREATNPDNTLITNPQNKIHALDEKNCESQMRAQTEKPETTTLARSTC